MRDAGLLTDALIRGGLPVIGLGPHSDENALGPHHSVHVRAGAEVRVYWSTRPTPLEIAQAEAIVGRHELRPPVPVGVLKPPPAACAEVDMTFLVDQFRSTPTRPLAADWNDERIIEAHRRLARECIATTPPYPDGYQGKGIVVCGGGHRLFTNAWVCVRMLRHLGCALPIQLWHLGECEMDDAMRTLVAKYGVECVDAETLLQDRPMRILCGWELKSYALIHSPFRHVLLLDADNVPVIDPSFLFDTPEYLEHGALFWPDFGRLDRSRSIWSICEVDYCDEPEFESGQMVVDKKACWKALSLALHYNSHSDFYYKHVHGDKETFHLAFRRVGKSYAMPRMGIVPLPGTMCQHDFAGRRLFQHRNLAKWRLEDCNDVIDGFQYEDLCRRHLADLRSLWCGRVHWKPQPDERELQEIRSWGRRRYRYIRVGHDERLLELRDDRTIGQGAASHERLWTIALRPDGAALFLLGDEQPTCRLMQTEQAWHGAWYRFERMPVILEPLP